MTLTGRYVRTFAEASHALPQGMHMAADYPFKLPRIVGILNGGVIQIRDGEHETSVRVERTPQGERASAWQVSSYERLVVPRLTRDGHPRPVRGRRFKLHPFKDDNTPAIGEAQGSLL